MVGVICGVADIEKKNNNFEFVRIMSDSMRYRGGSRGAYIEPPVALIQSDERSIGKRPYVTQKNGSNYAVLFDGNLRRIFGIDDLMSFASLESEEEIILEGYLSMGTDIFSHIEGDYSICIFDACRDETVLARDPSGKKTLYYADMDDKLFFCSEIKGLAALFGGTLKISAAALESAVLSGRVEVNEIFLEVRELLPSEWMSYSSVGANKFFYTPIISFSKYEKKKRKDAEKEKKYHSIDELLRHDVFIFDRPHFDISMLDKVNKKDRAIERELDLLLAGMTERGLGMIIKCFKKDIFSHLSEKKDILERIRIKATLCEVGYLADRYELVLL